MPFYRTKIYSGDVLEIEESFSARKRKNIPREKGKKNPTSEQQAALNFKNSVKKLCRLINTNFGKDDLFITLTHAVLISVDEAKKELGKYLRKIRDHRRKAGLPELKYIAVTESDGKRVHHHIVMSGLPLEDAIKKWNHGRVILSNLDNDGDYTGLANYITKEKRKEAGGKKWSASRNLEQPTVKITQIKRVTKVAKDPKGYKIIKAEFTSSELIGDRQYIKAIRIGGRDYSGKQVLRE